MGIRSEASVNLKSLSGGWRCTGPLNINALPILLNSGLAGDVKAPKLFPRTILDDTKFDYSRGWQVNPSGINSIVTRAPTHEPYPFHNQGTDAPTTVATPGQPTPPPAAVPVPENWQIRAR